MRKDKEKAIQLRLKGYSYSEINSILGVPKSSLSGWLRDLQISEIAQRRIQKRSAEGSRKGLLKKSKTQTYQARKRAKRNRAEARVRVGKLTERELILVAAALYWGEGYKKPIIVNGVEKTCHSVSLSNADPALLKIFIKFLEEVCVVEKSNIYGEIRIFEHVNENEAMKYWMKETGLPQKCFRNFYYGISKSSQNKKPYNRLPYGTLQIRVNKTDLYHQIMGYIEGLKAI